MQPCVWLFGLSCRLCSLASVQSSQLVGFLVRPSGLAIDTVHTAKPVCTTFVGGLSIACGVVSSRSIGWGYVLCVVCGCLLVSWQHQAAWVVCHGSRATQRLGLHINSCTCSAGFFAVARAGLSALIFQSSGFTHMNLSLVQCCQSCIARGLQRQGLCRLL